VEKQLVINSVTGGFAAIASQIVSESIGHMIPWLMVSGAVILCDLVCGIRKSLMMGEEVRFSSACRRTMGKAITYFSFVVMVAMIDVAAHTEMSIDKWACLLVCFIEGTSIVSNILKPKGYNVNLIKAIALLFENKLGVDGVEEVITKEEDEKS
jgi:hypothetical protein